MDMPETRAVPAPPGTPAELTTYVGRASEVSDARRMIAHASVVTLTGPGGVGKSRLAARLADLVAPDFSDGAVFVPLAEVRDADLVVSTIAEHVGLGGRSNRRALDSLCAALQDRRILLVLDNCEHLVSVCAEVVDAIARSCPGLVILCTSRQSLGVAGEQILPVRPMSIPEPGEALEHLGDYDAVQLFLERARAVIPDFTLTADNADDVVRLCHRLDGLPLAIELAAVRLRALSVRQIADRLDQRFTLLGGAGRRLLPRRHETLRALMEWSYELCSEQERLLWARLSVFAGSVYLEAAEEVCSGDGLERGSVLGVIEGLLDKSLLLRVEEAGEVRFTMLETIRQYGAERLAETDPAAWRRRHRDHFASFAHDLAEGWLGQEQEGWIHRGRRESSNLRLALDYCAGEPGEAVAGLRIAYDFRVVWLLRGTLTEGRHHIDRLLEAAPDDVPERAGVSWWSAFLALVQGDRVACERALDDADKLAARHDDEHTAAAVVHVHGYAALIDDDMVVAAPLFAEAAARLDALGDHQSALWSRYNHGLATALLGDLDAGREILRACISEYVERGEIYWRCWALWSLGAAEYLAGDLEQAAAACEEVLRHQAVVKDRAVLAFTLTVVAGVAAHRGQARRAARVFGAAAAAWRFLGTSPLRFSAFTPSIDRDTEQVTRQLGPEVATAEFMAGYLMRVDDAIAEALDQAQPAGAAPVASPLTPRQMQVAEMVALGMTNREIAEHLVISLRTVETHVDHITTKLGLSNRVQLAAWVSSQPPCETRRVGA